MTGTRNYQLLVELLDRPEVAEAEPSWSLVCGLAGKPAMPAERCEMRDRTEVGPPTTGGRPGRRERTVLHLGLAAINRLATGLNQDLGAGTAPVVSLMTGEPEVAPSRAPPGQNGS